MLGACRKASVLNLSFALEVLLHDACTPSTFNGNIDSLSCGANELEVCDSNFQVLTDGQLGIIIPTDVVPSGRIEIAARLFGEVRQRPLYVVPTVHPTGILTGELLCDFLLVSGTAGRQLEAEQNVGHRVNVGNVYVKFDIFHRGNINRGSLITLAVAEHKATGAVLGACAPEASVANVLFVLKGLLELTLSPKAVQRHVNGRSCRLLGACAKDNVGIIELLCLVYHDFNQMSTHYQILSCHFCINLFYGWYMFFL